MFVFAFDKNSVVWVCVHVHKPPCSCFRLRVSPLHDLPAVFDTQKWSLKLDFSSHLAGNDSDETHLELKSRRFHLIFPCISLQPQSSVPIIWVQTFPRPTAGSAVFWHDTLFTFPHRTHAQNHIVSFRDKQKKKRRERTPSANWVNFRFLCSACKHSPQTLPSNFSQAALEMNSAGLKCWCWRHKTVCLYLVSHWLWDRLLHPFLPQQWTDMIKQNAAAAAAKRQDYSLVVFKTMLMCGCKKSRVFTQDQLRVKYFNVVFYVDTWQ